MAKISGTIGAIGDNTVTINGQLYYVDLNTKLPQYLKYFRVGQFVEGTLKNNLLSYMADPNRQPTGQQQGGYQQPAPQGYPQGQPMQAPMGHPQMQGQQGMMPPQGHPQFGGQQQRPMGKQDYWNGRAESDKVRQIEIRANGLLNTAVQIVGLAETKFKTIGEAYEAVVTTADMLHQYVRIHVQAGDEVGVPTADMPQEEMHAGA